ncbi:hypothetical protein AXG93_1054s1130 [Marchantia polymorpha subsp. ruderalis]|uniref:Uncharacterized protein n=1 Tax=Marchantia polymorpha subsp. ruderalis TaxID=1480154 RepID=A0A176WMP2_MARPO|nr:hypothetical protein AXG93_1054s1130 [Marchantia polymorpha subsp. ruderalis]
MPTTGTPDGGHACVRCAGGNRSALLLTQRGRVTRAEVALRSLFRHGPAFGERASERAAGLLAAAGDEEERGSKRPRGGGGGAAAAEARAGRAQTCVGIRRVSDLHKSGEGGGQPRREPSRAEAIEAAALGELRLWAAERSTQEKMDGDDEFGDLYTDIGPEDGKTLDQYGGEGDGDMYDEDDEALLYGSSTPSLAPSSKAPLMPPSTIRNSGLQTGLAEKEVDNDELLLYGQLYGVTLETTVKAESPLRRVESKPISSFRPEKIKDSLDSRVLESGEDNDFDLSEEDRLNSAGDLIGKSIEIPLGGVGSSAGGGERGLPRDSIPFPPRMFDVFSNRSLAPENDTTSLLRLPHVNDVSMQISSPPGLSSSGHIPAEFAAEDDIEEQHMREDWEEGDDVAGEEGGEADAEEWDDSDSEDDLQIVLNDEAPIYAASERPVDGDVAEGSEDEDEEDLVIVAGDDDGPIEEQEWEEQPLATDCLPGLSGAPIPLGSERPPGAEERGASGKGSGAGGASPGVPRIGYSGQGYHAPYMQFKVLQITLNYGKP